MYQGIKFSQFKCNAAAKSISSSFEGVDWKQLYEFVKENDGKKFTLIIAEPCSWEIAQMRKYFEGVVVPFCCDLVRSPGTPVTNELMREYLKVRILGYKKNSIAYAAWETKLSLATTTVNIQAYQSFLAAQKKSGVHLPVVSSTTLDAKHFRIFLNQIDEWCMDEFKTSLPSPAAMID